MIKSIYLLSFSLLPIILSCDSDNSDNLNDSHAKTQLKKVQHTTCSIKFKMGENDSSYYIRHCSVEKKELNNGTSFIYSGKSFTSVNGSITHTDSSGHYTLIYRINQSNDTLYNSIKEDTYLQSYTFLLSDSLDVQIDNETFRLYTYERIHNKNEWDEVLYFSKELGLVYGYSKFFKGDKSLIHHSKIGSDHLNELRSRLKNSKLRTTQ